MEAWVHALLAALALPKVGLVTLFFVALLSATLLPLGSEPAVAGLLYLNPELFWPAMFVATAGNTIGGAISWWMGWGAERAYEKVKHRKPSELKALACWHFCPSSAIRCARSPAGCACHSGRAWATWPSANFFAMSFTPVRCCGSSLNRCVWRPDRIQR